MREEHGDALAYKVGWRVLLGLDPRLDRGGGGGGGGSRCGRGGGGRCAAALPSLGFFDGVWCSVELFRFKTFVMVRTIDRSDVDSNLFLFCLISNRKLC